MLKAKILAGFFIGLLELLGRFGIQEKPVEAEVFMPELGPVDVVTPQEIEEAKAAAKEFLLAPDLESLAPLIRDSERVMPLVQKYYANTPYQPAEIREKPFEGSTNEKFEDLVSFKVTMKDFSEKLIAVEMTFEGPKVDWESWVVYCDMPWDQFITAKSQETNKVRVKITKDTYYNFDYQDDEKWQCFRLQYPDSDDILFGYLPATSESLSQLPQDIGEANKIQVTIRFPENPKAANQVLISEPIADGWISDSP